jgi:RNA polymerase primary sigma factor
VKVEEILNGVHQDPISLDEPLNRQDARSHNDLLADPKVRPIDEELEDKQTHQQVYKLLNYLTPMEKDILLRRFGLLDDCDQTLEEIGEAYNLSRERVRQIQVQSLIKMKRMCIVNKIVS